MLPVEGRTREIGATKYYHNVFLTQLVFHYCKILMFSVHIFLCIHYTMSTMTAGQLQTNSRDQTPQTGAEA